MKVKTSITLSSALLGAIDRQGRDFRSRSEFIETAVNRYLEQLARAEAEKKDFDILNRRADALNAEAEDVLGYQVPI